MTLRASEEKPETRVRRKAMDYLARREHSYHELLLKLNEKFPEFAELELTSAVLDRLSSENLQSDERFVESYVRYRAGLGHGPIKIIHELERKGVTLHLIQKNVHAAEFDWQDSALQVLRKKAKMGDQSETGEELSPKVRQRWFRFLQQRGFNHEQSNRAILSLIDNKD